LERAKGKEFLNFGCSGSLGPIQYYLVYDRLAKFFSHDQILVGILPANDFDDDNYELWVDSGRRRPFWVGKGADRELRYTEARPRNGFGPRLHRFLKEYSYFYNAFESLKQRWKWRQRNVQAGIHSRFYDFSEEEMERMLFSLQKLREASRGKNLTLMLIPLYPDAERYAQEGKSPLTKRLEAWAAGQDVVVIDLLPWFQQRGNKVKAYSHRCDNHWNARGHQAAFELIEKYF
ncbi:MAG TPA: SGNH/GDSL hydrolase family protein, partial [bacterium]|nr:SGNH/GDSL hydrolase family protein [bacterium]